MSARVTAVLATVLLASAAHAVRLGPGGLRVDPAVLTLTRTVTITMDLEDDSNLGSMELGVDVEADPRGVVSGLEQRQPELFSCTPGGRSSARWVYLAVGTGTVRFRMKVGMVACQTMKQTSQVFVSAPVTVRAARIDSSLVIEPRPAAPGDTLVYSLRLRNTGSEEVYYPAPRADVDWGGRGEPVVEPAGGPEADPPAVMTATGLRLPPGEDVMLRWRFRAQRAGESRIQIIAAGLLIRPPPSGIRLPAKLDFTLGPLAGPTAVGRIVTLRGSLGALGDAGVRDLEATASWSPADAARLAAVTLSATRIVLDGPRAGLAVALEMLRPGPLMLTVSVAGRETDSGRPVAAPPLTRLIAVQAPPELSCVLVPGSATVLAGSRSPVRLAVINRSATRTIGLAPITVIRRGDADTAGFTPLHASVPGSGSVWFAGAVIPESPGEVEFAAQVTGRGDRGGAWLTATSEPAWIRAVAPPRFEVWPLPDRSFQGMTATVRFLVRNAGEDEVRITSASLNLAVTGGGGTAPRVSPLPLVLAAGAAATLSAQSFLPPAAAPYQVNGNLSFSGTLTGWRLAFSTPVGSRPLLRAGPPATAISNLEPAAVFRPVTDPLLFVEWTKTIAGDAGVAVTRPDGRPVKTIRALGPMARGFYTALWQGVDDAGRIVPPGPYQVRLAGPLMPGAASVAATVLPAGAVSSTSVADAAPVWPMGAAWVRDRAFTVAP